jgi:hypothetical protein
MPFQQLQQLQKLPGTVVRTGLQAARLPLNAAESVLRRGEQSGEWAPAIAFEGIEANVKRVAGSLLRDETLVEEGRLEQAKVDKLRKAARLEAIAREHEQSADAEYRQRIESDEQRRAQVAKQADQQETALERQRAARERAAEEEKQRKAAAARKVEAATKKAVEKNARSARATRVEAETTAVARERKAVEAKAGVVQLDEDLRATKAARQANT